MDIDPESSKTHLLRELKEMVEEEEEISKTLDILGG